MTANKIDTLNVSFTKRNARRRGPTSSEAWNDSFDEIAVDLAGLYDQWNNRLKSLIDTLPDSSVSSSIDAFTNGLSGQTIYTKSDADISDITYYNSESSRPNTLYEQMAVLYTYIDDINESLGNQISGRIFSAGNLSIQDVNDIYDSTNVEDALYEVKVLVDNYTTGNVYLGVTGGTITGNLEITAGQAYTTPSVITLTGTTQEIDWNNGNFQVIDLQNATGNLTLTFTNPKAGAGYSIKFIQSSVARTVTFPATALWEGGAAPVISVGEDDIDVISFIYDGTNYLGSYAQDLS